MTAVLLEAHVPPNEIRKTKPNTVVLSDSCYCNIADFADISILFYADRLSQYFAIAFRVSAPSGRVLQCMAITGVATTAVRR